MLGLSGGGKSVELLQNALDFKHFNKDLKLDDGRKPVILFVSQENSIRETMERIWSFYNGTDSDFKSYNPEEAIKILNEKGFNKGPELLIKYRSSKSISTVDVAAMIEEIEEEGDKKCIAVIQDYLKRIKSSQYFKANSNLYEELGAVTDEFCAIAKDYNTVVISAMQLNRTALSKVEEAMKKKKEDPLKEIGSSDIGESVRIIDNSDVIYSIHRQPNSLTGETMISYKLMKFRGKRSVDAPDYFSHPFESGNGMKLTPDLNLTKSLSVTELGNGLTAFNAVENRKMRKEKAEKAAGGRLTVDKEKRKNLLEDDDE